MGRYILFVLLLPLGTAFAYEPERATNNYAHELAECSAFYMLSSLIVKAQKPDVSKNAKKLGGLAIKSSATLTSEKLAHARAEMATKTMLKEIDNDAVNFSILLNKYADPCREALSDSKVRMDYWLNKRD
ncbi:hypothetical protein [Pseudomonas sp. LB3P58]